ncbi:MAG: globin [Hyphomonadaceae bacterium]
MLDQAAILATLELVADRHGDPTDMIYAELFGRRPDLKQLFWLDRDGSVRAAMAQQALECILDLTDEGRSAAIIIADERSRHDGYGVPPDQFDDFFAAIRDACRRILGTDWSDAMDRAWDGLLARIAAIRSA